MIQHAVLVLGAVTVVLACDFRYELSPFYWKNQENVCSDDLCITNPDIPACDDLTYDQEFLMMTAKAHVKANVTLEMKVMSEYFNTLIPGPAINSKFKCTGICEQKMQSLKLKRIFTTVMVQDQKDYMNTQLIPTHMACIVIGPDIYYRKCGGQCNLPDRYNRYCLPDVTVKIKVWVFCPNVSPGCHKVDFDVPISCSCKKIECNKGYDINKEWDARQGAVNPGNPIGVAIGLTG